MAQPEKRENSVLFSLRELRTIEESRVKEEEDAAQAAEQARIRARLDAERRAKEEEDAKVRATEEAARHEREMADKRLREEQMRIQETEARARAEHQANLAAALDEADPDRRFHGQGYKAGFNAVDPITALGMVL